MSLKNFQTYSMSALHGVKLFHGNQQKLNDRSYSFNQLRYMNYSCYTKRYAMLRLVKESNSIAFNWEFVFIVNPECFSDKNVGDIMGVTRRRN